MESQASREAPRPAKPACRLTGTDGNAFAVIGTVRRAVVAAGEPRRAADFVELAWRAESHDHLLRLAMEFVAVE